MSGLKIFALTPLMASFTLPDSFEKAGLIGALVAAVAALWLDSNRRQNKLEKIIDANAKATTAATEVLRGHTAVLVELKDAVKTCRDSNTPQPWDGVERRKK